MEYKCGWLPPKEAKAMIIIQNQYSQHQPGITRTKEYGRKNIELMLDDTDNHSEFGLELLENMKTAYDNYNELFKECVEQGYLLECEFR